MTVFLGQAILSTFLRSLHHLTAKRSICSILVNSAVGLSSSIDSRYSHGSVDDASIFGCSSGRPALGKAYAQLLDLSILISHIPKAKKDAHLMHSISRSSLGRYGVVSILEILKDRNAAREGQWGPFEIESGVMLLSYE